MTVGALLAEQMLDTDGLAGLPAALFTLGSALTAFLVGRVTQRPGRRTGLGLGIAAGGLGRYAGTDLAPAAQRATAVGVALVSTTVGAVAGPNLVEPLGALASSLGLPELSGPSGGVWSANP